MSSKYSDVHKIWYKFQNHFKKWYYKKYFGYKKDLTESKRQYKEFDSTQMKGYQAMCRVKKYIETNPEIEISYVDDSYHSGSMLVFIPHPTMGITVIYIPQNGNELNQFFLYPEHQKEMLKILKRGKICYLK